MSLASLTSGWSMPHMTSLTLYSAMMVCFNISNIDWKATLTKSPEYFIERNALCKNINNVEYHNFKHISHDQDTFLINYSKKIFNLQSLEYLAVKWDHLQTQPRGQVGKNMSFLFQSWLLPHPRSMKHLFAPIFLCKKI